MKWFSLDQIEEARAYYSQFAKEGALTGAEETVNREEYYNDTILQYTPYIDKGVFNVKNEYGRESYIFSALNNEDAMSLFFDANIECAVQINGRSASSATRLINIFDMGDGTYRFLERMLTSSEYGGVIEMYEIKDEEYIISTYNECYFLDGDQRVTSVQGIIQRELGQ